MNDSKREKTMSKEGQRLRSMAIEGERKRTLVKEGNRGRKRTKEGELWRKIVKVKKRSKVLQLSTKGAKDGDSNLLETHESRRL